MCETRPIFSIDRIVDDNCFESVAHSNEAVKHIDKEKWVRALGVESMRVYPEHYAAKVTARLVLPAPAVRQAGTRRRIPQTRAASASFYDGK